MRNLIEVRGRRPLGLGDYETQNPGYHIGKHEVCPIDRCNLPTGVEYGHEHFEIRKAAGEQGEGTLERQD